MQQFILKFHRGAFSRIYIFSPTCHLDHTWAPCIEYIRHVMKVPEKEEFCFEEWDDAMCRKLIADHTRIVAEQKKKGKRIAGCLFIIDDFADDPKVTHDPKNATTSLFIRGRHAGISCWIGTQKIRAIATPVRVNSQALFIFRLRNQFEYDQIAEEVSALVDKKTFRELYDYATAEPYSFLYINLAAPTSDTMFFLRFDQRLIPQ